MIPTAHAIRDRLTRSVPDRLVALRAQLAVLASEAVGRLTHDHHGKPVVAAAVDRSAKQLFGTGDIHTVLNLGYRDAQLPEIVSHGGYPVGLLHPQLLGIPDGGDTFRACRRNADDREFINSTGNDTARNGDSF